MNAALLIALALTVAILAVCGLGVALVVIGGARARNADDDEIALARLLEER